MHSKSKSHPIQTVAIWREWFPPCRIGWLYRIVKWCRLPVHGMLGQVQDSHQLKALCLGRIQRWYDELSLKKKAMCPFLPLFYSLSDLPLSKFTGRSKWSDHPLNDMLKCINVKSEWSNWWACTTTHTLSKGKKSVVQWHSCHIWWVFLLRWRMATMIYVWTVLDDRSQQLHQQTSKARRIFDGGILSLIVSSIFLPHHIRTIYTSTQSWHSLSQITTYIYSIQFNFTLFSLYRQSFSTFILSKSTFSFFILSRYSLSFSFHTHTFSLYAALYWYCIVSLYQCNYVPNCFGYSYKWFNLAYGIWLYIQQ